MCLNNINVKIINKKAIGLNNYVKIVSNTYFGSMMHKKKKTQIMVLNSFYKVIKSNKISNFIIYLINVQ